MHTVTSIDHTVQSVCACESVCVLKSTVLLQKDVSCPSLRGCGDDGVSLLCRNFSLQKMPLPLADITQSYRSNPEGTKEALHKVGFRF